MVALFPKNGEINSVEKLLKKRAKSNTIKSSVFLILIAPYTFLISGCSDLSNVQKFADTSKQAAVQFRNIESDIYQTCLRRTQYKFQEDDPTSLPKEEDVEANCIQEEKISTEMAGYHKVIENYMQTMSSLAADDLPVFDDSLDTLGSQIEALGVNKTRVSAVNGLTKFLFNALGSNYQRRNIKTAIRDANGDVQILLASLRRIVNSNYNEMLGFEGNSLESYYECTVFQKQCLIDQNQVHSQDSLSIELLKEKWEKARKGVNSKREAARSYVKIIDEISVTHQTLYENSDKLTSTEIDQILRKDVLVLLPLIDNIQKAF